MAKSTTKTKPAATPAKTHRKVTLLLVLFLLIGSVGAYLLKYSHSSIYLPIRVALICQPAVCGSNQPLKLQIYLCNLTSRAISISSVPLKLLSDCEIVSLDRKKVVSLWRAEPLIVVTKCIPLPVAPHSYRVETVKTDPPKKLGLGPGVYVVRLTFRHEVGVFWGKHWEQKIQIDWSHPALRPSCYLVVKD